MVNYLSSLDEDRFLGSYSFLRLMLLLLAGSLFNAAVTYLYAYKMACCTVTNGVTNLYPFINSDFRLLIVWIAVFPIFWATFSTFMLPAKLRVSPFDLQLATAIIVTFIYFFVHDTNWISLGFYDGIILVAPSLPQSVLVAELTGLGRVGKIPYYYDSFILSGKSVNDFTKCYQDEQYRDWSGLPNVEIEPERALKPNRIMLSSATDSKLGIFVFMSNKKEGLLTQIIAFEKGKYTIFNSKNSRYHGEQLKRMLLWELKVSDPIPYSDELEREHAEKAALRVTEFVAVVRGLMRRDKIVLGIALILLAADYLLWVTNVHFILDPASNAFLIALFAGAELSYTRIKSIRFWKRVAKTQSAEKASTRPPS